jgi:hypothetical protein
MLSPDEIKKLKKNTITSYKDSDLAGARICHGTGLSQVRSILGGPMEMNNGLGGPGLNVVFEKDDHVAADYAYDYTPGGIHYTPGEKGVILIGELNPNPAIDYRVIHIHTCYYLGAVDIETGRFPLTWSLDPNIRNFVKQNADIIDMHMPKTNLSSFQVDRFLVLNQNVGPEAILWKGTRPLLEARRINKSPPGSTPTIKALFSTHAPSGLVEIITPLPHRKPKVITELQLLTLLPVPARDYFPFSPSFVPYYGNNLPSVHFIMASSVPSSVSLQTVINQEALVKQIT